MQNTIFTVELPLVKTDQELDEIIEMYLKYDPYFIASGCCKERRKKFDKLWLKYLPYADTHFLSQIRINFHQRSWEMYVGNTLLEKKLSIKSQGEGPDFIVMKDIYIECVAPTKGDPLKANSVPEMFVDKKPERTRVQDVPVDKMILRITQVIKDKALYQYNNWKTKKWFNIDTPFVIAINTGDLGYIEDPSMPNVLKALFGFQFMQINIKTGRISYSHRDKIEKDNSESVLVNYFVNDELNFVSGVLFSDKTVLNHPENIGDDIIFVNNPFAINPVGDEFIKLFKSWTVGKDDKEINLKKGY